MYNEKGEGEGKGMVKGEGNGDKGKGSGKRNGKLIREEIGERGGGRKRKWGG